MALIDCYECHAEISDQAVACPKCGAAQTKRAKTTAAKVARKKEKLDFAKSPEGKRRTTLANLAGLTIIVVGGFWLYNNVSERAQPDVGVSANSAAPAAKVAAAGDAPAPAKSEAEKKKEDTARYMRVRRVSRAIQESLNNPKSYEFVNALYMPDRSICITYRGSNAFGGVVTEQMAIDRADQPGDWDKLCAGKRGIKYE